MRATVTKRSHAWSFFVMVATALAMPVSFVGCASERDPINRVQLNAIPKRFLLGDDYTGAQDDPEFYARSMVIKVPFGESGADNLMFTNTINSTAKIKWQIQEDKLLGRVSFERIEGSDGQGKPAADTPAKRDPQKPLALNDGIVAYAFRIESHFDVRRAYNAQTGEETNVIEENVSDRPWTQRDYVRVDFSENLVTTAYDFDTLSLLGVYDGIEYSSIGFDISNPKDENAPVIDLAGGYFDVTNKVFANPKMVDFGGGFQLPGCMLPSLIGGGTYPVGNCNPNELTIRHSFKRVVDTDYEPMDWDGQRQETAGAFHSNRDGYARDYGLVDAKQRRFINRYNLWERSHYYSNPKEMTGAVACSVDADCIEIGEVAGVSHCDQARSMCSLPYAQRVPKPVVWHYAEGSDQAFFEATREAAEEWDTALRIAVAVAKYAECKKFTPERDCGVVPTGNFADEEDASYLVKEVNACKRGDGAFAGKSSVECDAIADQVAAQRGYSAGAVAIAKAAPMVVLCHSPVTTADAAVCGKPGTVARLGDLRHHLVTSVATPETGSPWGIMTDANDPTTGEHVAASMNVWTSQNDLFARTLVDTLRYIGGELKTADVTEGTYVNAWVEAARLGDARAGVVAPVLGQHDVDRRVAAAAGTSTSSMQSADSLRETNQQAASVYGALLGSLRRVAETKGALDAPSLLAPTVQSRVERARGTSVEAALVTPAMQQLAAFGATAPGGGAALEPDARLRATSVLRGLDPHLWRAYEHRREASLASRGACIMNFEATAPLGYVALGGILQQKFGNFNPADPPEVQSQRADRMKDYLRRRVHSSVMSHEMGHSIALRHNFVSSSDAWNYRPQYWQLRTNDKASSATACNQDGSSDGKTCVGPRWLDPLSANEARNLLPMWAQSSTMDYAGEPSQDLLGLGAYDFHAARLFYANAATVYAAPRFGSTQPAGGHAQRHQDDFGGLLGYRYGTFAAPIHYSELDKQVSLIESCAGVDAQLFRPAAWRDDRDGAWNPLIDGHIVTNEAGQFTRCKQPSVDYVTWETLKSTANKARAFDAAGRVRVPYGFASDEWADLGNVSVYRHDAGADPYETMHFWIAQQEMNHIFANYRRGRRDFSVWSAFQRTLRRYQEKMRDSAKAIGLYITIARDTVTLYNDASQSADPQAFVGAVLRQVAPDNVAASSLAFDYFAHVFARPQPGDHAQVGVGDPVLRALDEAGNSGGFSQAGLPLLRIANGVTGGFGAIALGGRPIENKLATDRGRDYNRDYTLNVGSYYEKAFVAMLLTESRDNFISANREDFVDPRFRSVSIADVFPDGFRRWLGNNLTNDDTVKGVYVRGNGTSADVDSNGYAMLGQTSWWPVQGIETCFAQGERLACRDPFDAGPVGSAGLGPAVDPQVGWEQQKFALLMTLLHLPENGRLNWIDQMTIVPTLAPEQIPFANRIEFHDPDGTVYVAKTFGTETLRGKVVQKGIAARVLEYANELLRQGVETEPVVRNGLVVGYRPLLDAAGNIKYRNGAANVAACENSQFCTKMKNYAAVPKLMVEAMGVLGWTRGAGSLKGVY